MSKIPSLTTLVMSNLHPCVRTKEINTYEDIEGIIQGHLCASSDQLKGRLAFKSHLPQGVLALGVHNHIHRSIIKPDHLTDDDWHCLLTDKLKGSVKVEVTNRDILIRLDSFIQPNFWMELRITLECWKHIVSDECLPDQPLSIKGRVTNMSSKFIPSIYHNTLRIDDQHNYQVWIEISIPLIEQLRIASTNELKNETG